MTPMKAILLILPFFVLLGLITPLHAEDIVIYGGTSGRFNAAI
jgi:hypothetical protein